MLGNNNPAINTMLTNESVAFYMHNVYSKKNFQTTGTRCNETYAYAIAICTLFLQGKLPDFLQPTLW